MELQQSILLGLVAVAVLSQGSLGAVRPPEECAGQRCDHNKILRFNGTCYCEPNPCREMACQDPNYPHLDFEYNRQGQQKCFCTRMCPHGLCGGERKPPDCVERGSHCPTSKHPILTKDANGECVCNSHPCKDAGRAGCSDPLLPWLDYHWDADGKLDCFCRQHPCPTLQCAGQKDMPVVKWDQEGNCYCGAKDA